MRSHAEDPTIRSARYEAVYFGGGTPTVLAPDDLRRVLNGLHESFDIPDGAEITMETSVTDLSDEHIEACRRGGVTRFSVGVQTFVDRGRRWLQRHGSGEGAAQKLRDLLDAGFRNVGIDLIYNWPGQTEEDLEADLETIRSLDIAGLSFYALILMEKAPLHAMIASGQCPAMGDLDHERMLFDRAVSSLIADGYCFLELTKLVKPDRDRYDYVRIRYANGDTLPLGAGAGGSIGGALRMNPADPEAYRAYVEDLPSRPGPWIRATQAYNAAKRLIGWIEFGGFHWTDLDGLQLEAPMLDALRALIDDLMTDGLVLCGSRGVCLTEEGIFYGNNVAHELATVIANHTDGGDSTRSGATTHPPARQKHPSHIH
jgi:oxygen-independent coproporphyrinogen-3 oxidase